MGGTYPGAFTIDDPSDQSRAQRDYRGLIILAVLGGLEVAILYALIALETPLTPLVHRLLESALGVFLLVIWVTGLLSAGMWGFASWAEWYHKKQTGSARPR